MQVKKLALISVASITAASLIGLTAFADNEGKQEKEARALGAAHEVHITQKGHTLARGAKVTSISGNTINAVSGWESASLNWAVVADSSAEIIRRHGGKGSLSEVSVGDIISFQGTMDPTIASPLTVKAKIIRDFSVQKITATVNGTIKSVNASTTSFVINDEKLGDIAVSVGSTTKITYGNQPGTFANILVNARAMVSGLYNSALKTLQADAVKIHLPSAQRTTIEGKLASTTASTLSVVSGNKTFTVNIYSDTSILNTYWLKTSLSNFKTGDTIRVYGTVNSDLTVDATVIRNTSLR